MSTNCGLMPFQDIRAETAPYWGYENAWPEVTSTSCRSWRCSLSQYTVDRIEWTLGTKNTNTWKLLYRSQNKHGLRKCVVPFECQGEVLEEGNTAHNITTHCDTCTGAAPMCFLFWLCTPFGRFLHQSAPFNQTLISIKAWLILTTASPHYWKLHGTEKAKEMEEQRKKENVWKSRDDKHECVWQRERKREPESMEEMVIFSRVLAHIESFVAVQTLCKTAASAYDSSAANCNINKCVE